jgi:hypothetical protein
MGRNKKKQHTNPASVIARVDGFIKGIDQGKLDTKETINVLGTSYTPAQAKSVLVTIRSRYTKVDDAELLASKLRMERDQAEPDAIHFLDTFESGLRGRFGDAGVDLESFDVKPRKRPRDLTPEERVERHKKQREARERRKRARG